MKPLRPSIDEIQAGFVQLLAPKEPWVFKAACDSTTILSALLKWQKRHPNIKVFVLEGSMMRTAEGFYDELKRKLALPDYFGKNLNALSECLTDPGVLKGSGFAILFIDGCQVLKDESPEMTEGALSVLRSAGAEWAVPAINGEVWDHPAVPFHSIIQFNSNIANFDLLPNLLTITHG